jgi:hypothetical protein
VQRCRWTSLCIFFSQHGHNVIPRSLVGCGNSRRTAGAARGDVINRASRENAKVYGDVVLGPVLGDLECAALRLIVGAANPRVKDMWAL